MKTAIITDSNSGITQDEAKKLGISVVPMPVLIDEELYFEDLTLSQEQFYEKLKGDANVSTSQPNPIDVGEIWAEALKTNDAVIYIPMSSGLSETCHTLSHYAKTEQQFNGKVFVVDNQRISITQRQSVEDAIKLADEGKTAQEIYDYLMNTKMQSSIYIMVDTLKYLKKGGRLSGAAAFIGTMLKIKPVITFSLEGKVEVISKQFGINKGINYVVSKVDKDKIDFTKPVYLIYTADDKNSMALISKLNIPYTEKSNICPVIGVHNGARAAGIVYAEK